MKINLEEIERNTNTSPTTEAEAIEILKNCLYYLSHHNKNLTKKQDEIIYIASEIINAIRL